MMNINPAHKLIIITAPSGSGKTTIVNYLLNTMPTLAFSVSACTRKPREGEVDGVNYFFLSVETFLERVAHHEFAEFEMVYQGKYYGTLKSELERIWASHKTPLIDIDVQGALRLMKHYGSQALSIFIQAPSFEILEKRLEARGTETAETLKERIDKAKEELTYDHSFSKKIVNETLEIACSETQQLIEDFLQ